MLFTTNALTDRYQLMEVAGTVRLSSDIIHMDEPGIQNQTADGTPNPAPQSASASQRSENSTIIAGQKFDGRQQVFLREKTLEYSMIEYTEENKPLDDGPGPKSPTKKVPDVSELPNNISKSRTLRFHKLFKSTPVEEYPIESFSCAFKGDILLHGQMYVSHNWVCFYSKIKARGRCIEIPFERIISITREKLALIIPNAIGIQTADQKYVFGSFMSRDSTYKKMVALWKLNQDSTSGNLGLSLDVGGGVLCAHSEDSTETDTTEDDIDAGEQLDRILSAPSGHRRVEVEITRHSEPAQGNRHAGNQKCLHCRSAVKTFCSLSLRLQKIPRTNMLLAICTILVFFLLLSAIGLTYKILLLQSRLEFKTVWSPKASVSFRDRAMSNLYWLQTESHASVVRQLHSVLEANIHLLEEVHVLLKSLYRDPDSSKANCSEGEK